METRHGRPRDVPTVGQHRPAHVLGASRGRQRTPVGVERVDVHSTVLRAQSLDAAEQVRRIGFAVELFLLARGLRGVQEDRLEQPVRPGPDAVEDAHDGDVAHGVGVDEVTFHIRMPSVDGVLRECMEVVLRERVPVAADLEHVLDAGRDRHFDDVAGVLDDELRGVISEQQRWAMDLADARCPDVDRGLTHPLGTRRESWVDLAPMARADRRGGSDSTASSSAPPSTRAPCREAASSPVLAAHRPPRRLPPPRSCLSAAARAGSAHA